MERPERCIRRFVLTAVKNVRFHSNPMEAGRYTAENAILNEDPREDIKLTCAHACMLKPLKEVTDKWPSARPVKKKLKRR